MKNLRCANTAAISEIGIDLKAVCLKLQDDGVKAFADSFDSLMQTIQAKQAAMTSGLADRMEAALGKA